MARRTRSLVQATILGGIGLALLLALKLVVLGEIVLVLAGIVLVSGQLVPPVYRAIDSFGRLLGGAAATALTWALLVPFFFACFVPARFVLALLGRDPMRRRFPGREASYWMPHVRAGDPRRQS